MVSKKEHTNAEQYRLALEATRADLWGVNEDLHNKIKMLEEGQTYLQQKLLNYERDLSSTDDLDGIASNR